MPVITSAGAVPSTLDALNTELVTKATALAPGLKTTLPGSVIPSGFVVSDGTHQYVTQDPAIISGSGNSAPTFCLAVDEGSWAIPATSVTVLVTSVPSTVVLNCSNPGTGIPGEA